MVADPWSQRYHVSQLVAKNRLFKLCKEFEKLNLGIVANTKVMEMEVDSTLLQNIWKGEVEDEKIYGTLTNVCCRTKEGSMCLMSRN
jgi:hypothetical protein